MGRFDRSGPLHYVRRGIGDNERRRTAQGPIDAGAQLVDVLGSDRRDGRRAGRGNKRRARIRPSEAGRRRASEGDDSGDVTRDGPGASRRQGKRKQRQRSHRCIYRARRPDPSCPWSVAGILGESRLFWLLPIFINNGAHLDGDDLLGYNAFVVGRTARA